MKTLIELYSEHKGKSSDKWSSYLSKYDNLFTCLRGRDIALLEIGTQNGGSLEIWSKYFTHAKALIGCDINPDCAKLSYTDLRIKLIIGDVNTQLVEDEILGICPNFDLIIDDGSHLPSDIVKSFFRYFRHLSDGGYFIAEDLHCSYWAEFEGGLYHPFSSISFFKCLADVINHEHWGVEKSRASLLAGFSEKFSVSFDEAVLASIYSIEFFNSVCVVRKVVSKPLGLGKRFIAGSEELVVSGHSQLMGAQSNVLSQIDNFWSKSDLALGEVMAELQQTIGNRDAQIVTLTKTVGDRDAQIVGLVQALADSPPICRLIWRGGKKAANQMRRARAYLKFFSSLVATFGLFGVLKKFFFAMNKEGFAGVKVRVRNIIYHCKATSQTNYGMSQEKYLDTPEIVKQVEKRGPKISVIISIYKPPIEMLKEAIDSVRFQGYKNWELILVDDYSDSYEIKQACEVVCGSDNRVKYVMRSENGNISAANNTGLSHATGSFFTILDHDDVLAPDALYEIAKAVVNYQDVDYIYSDEDKVSKDGSICFGPFFKPDWSPEYMLAMMYTCHVNVFRTSLIRSLGGYDSDFDGAQDYELALRVTRKTNNICHIPRVLYHWRVWENSTAQAVDAKPMAHTRARKALEIHLQELDENYKITEAVLPGHHFVSFYPKRESLVSIVIPTANGSININGREERHINAVCESILLKTAYKNYEIIVVHNGNISDDQMKWFEIYKNIRLSHYASKEFNLSEKINQGARLAKGEYLVIMNDDIRVISEDWLTLMLGMVQREGVGIVGPKLLFPDETIQHAGVVMLGGLPGHAYYQQPKDAYGYGLGLQVNRNYIAVTGACCITPKLLFEEIGGYSTRYALNYNDVDYCLKANQLGYRAVYVANTLLYHYEGVSKEGGRSVASSEIEMFLSDWSHKYKVDPYYNVNLSQFAPYA